VTATLLRAGWQGGVVYPSAATTGPAALGGTGGLTPVTISSTATIANTAGSPGSWVGGTTNSFLVIENVAFTCQSAFNLTSTIPVLFYNCTFFFTAYATAGSPVLFSLNGTGPFTFSYCQMAGATTGDPGLYRIDQVINQAVYCPLTIDHCDMGFMRQGVQIATSNTDAIAITNNYMHDIYLFDVTAPAPAVAAGGTSNTVTAGTYGVVITYSSAGGESLASPVTQVTVTAGQAITITSPPTLTGWTDWYAYVTQPGGSTYYKQQSSPGTGIGSNLLLTTTPTTSGSSSPPEGDHSECIYASPGAGGGSNITITGNTILNPLTQTACIFLHEPYVFSSTTISGNFIAGGAFCLQLGGGSPTDLIVTNNVFSTIYNQNLGTNYPVYPTNAPTFNGATTNVWADNTCYDGPYAGYAVPWPGSGSPWPP